MLSLREAASNPDSTEPLSLSEHTRLTTDIVLMQHTSGVTSSCDDRSELIQPAEPDVSADSADWHHKQGALAQTLGDWYEMKSSTARV